MSETEEQHQCRYCHGESLFIMDTEDFGEANIWVSKNFLNVTVLDTYGICIKYCPMCGRKL